MLTEKQEPKESTLESCVIFLSKSFGNTSVLKFMDIVLQVKVSNVWVVAMLSVSEESLSRTSRCFAYAQHDGFL